MTFILDILKITKSFIMLAFNRDLYKSILNIGAKQVRLEAIDPREITVQQRKKIYVLFSDIAWWNGDTVEDIKDHLKIHFISSTDQGDFFSLSDTSVTVAGKFIDFLIRFCIENHIPTRRPLYELCDDIYRYEYHCIAQRICAVCGRDYSDIHHLTGSTIGMGGNRKQVSHVGRRCVALCREHHTQAHNSEKDFMKKHKLEGVKLDAYLCSMIDYTQ